MLLSNIKVLFVLLLLPGTVSYPSPTRSSLARGPLLNSVAQVPAGEWCSHPSWLALQLAPTNTMPYRGKDEVTEQAINPTGCHLSSLPFNTS